VDVNTLVKGTMSMVSMLCYYTIVISGIIALKTHTINLIVIYPVTID
jgi:hypothetical protein